MNVPRHRRVISNIDKQRIVNAYLDENRDYVEAAGSLGIARGTAWSIIRRYQLTVNVIARVRGGHRPRLIDHEMQECMYHWNC